MKYLVAQWKPTNRVYGMTLFVVRSNHPRFVDGSHFDYGFLNLASREGYTVTILPSAEIIDKTIKDGYLTAEKEGGK